MKQDPGNRSEPLQKVFDYHQATKHYPQGYARGPGYLDWATQPNPFRRYEGAPLIPLEKFLPTAEPLYDNAFVPGQISPVPVNLQSISQLFYDSLAISAWKSTGETRWALRVNPSSGNLHPTEGYLVCSPIEGLCDKPMVCHYAPKEHGLEVRAEFELELWEKLCVRFPKVTFFIGLTSIHWREAWKYGQRAYRYCQHDAGHAIGAISVAAAGLGWQARSLDDLSTDELALLTGTFREHDAEPEEPDVLMALGPFEEETNEVGLPEEHVLAFASHDWQGKPNKLSTSHVEWGMEKIAEAARKPSGSGRYKRFKNPPKQGSSEIRPVSLRKIISQRRSAVAMDGETQISRDTFYRILEKTLAVPGNIPFSTLPWKPHIHLAIFVHRVDDLPPGLYFLVRYWEQFVAAWKKFLAELRSFWNWLRGLRERPETESAEAGAQVAPPVYRSFASFSNPFNRSSRHKWTVEQMVLYSFEALEAWARESGYGRQEHETPSEFTRSLGKHSKELAPSMRRIGKLYSRAAYAPGKLPDSCLDDVRSFWQLLPAPRSHTLAAPATSTAS